jgi:hypothetical protein
MALLPSRAGRALVAAVRAMKVSMKLSAKRCIDAADYAEDHAPPLMPSVYGFDIPSRPEREGYRFDTQRA